MTEDQAKKHLRQMLRSFTPGSILNLLADLFREAAEDARRAGETTVQQQRQNVAITLHVVGLGIDAAHPR